jgi:hypothetical protein
VTREEHDRLRDIKDAIIAIREHLAGAEQDRAQKDIKRVLEIVNHDLPPLEQAIDRLI